MVALEFELQLAEVAQHVDSLVALSLFVPVVMDVYVLVAEGEVGELAARDSDVLVEVVSAALAALAGLVVGAEIAA